MRNCTVRRHRQSTQALQSTASKIDKLCERQSSNCRLNFAKSLLSASLKELPTRKLPTLPASRLARSCHGSPVLVISFKQFFPKQNEPRRDPRTAPRLCR